MIKAMQKFEKETQQALQKKEELLSEKVYREIHNMIALHRFEPGLRVNLEKVAREIGVSRTPVREAIRRLEQEGIVKTIPNRGVFMLENPLERAIEMEEARCALDKLAGRLAAIRITKRIVGQLSRCLDKQLQAIELGDLALYSSSDFQFHRLIYEASCNVYLKELFELIMLQMLPARLEIVPILPSLYVGHQEILEALKERDPDGAEAASARHTEFVMEHTKEMIRTAHERKEMVRRIRARRPSGDNSQRGSENKTRAPYRK
jgi:DNA-binding GntR family transcriptional regulator